jgi:4-amino-4-deoxy-L-arabinose transferase-like glycosyltransferase
VSTPSPQPGPEDGADDGADDQAGDQRRQRFAWVRTALAALASTVALLTLYYTLPIVPSEGDKVWWQLLVAAAVFAVVLLHQVRAIVRHPQPLHRAIVSLAVLLPLFVVMYAWVYLTLSTADPATFDGAMSRTESLYYTVTVATSVGFGDITPKTDTARIVTMLQMAADVTILVVGVRLIVNVGRQASEQRRSTALDEEAGPDPS